MKLSSTLALGALLVSGAAFSASTPAAAATATPVPAAQPAHKHSSAMHCEKLARNKGLAGDDEKKFVKECRAGKKA
jgi:Spy/CpxP family protein refolding chaperone